MIKLNNKKITYVALADSNNSVKGVKEIWYADSNNSVKLVYRRKDALIEGEDYEKYHWLEGDDSAYIQGIQYNLWDNHIVLRVGKIQNPRTIMSYSGGTDKGRLHIMVNTDTGQSEPYLMVTFRELDSPAVHIADIRPFSSMPDIVDMDFYISNSTFYCEQNGVIKTNNPSQTAVESSWSSITPKIQSSKMSYIREVLPNDTYRSNLIPCKLLQSIPKWLDANGIRRQVGECGMIDLVSGKFYGNVNSVGTFTVENYYERKEWLIADIPDNTRCIDLPINSDEMSYSMLIKKVGNNTFFETVGNYRYYTTVNNIPSITVWNIATSSNAGSFNVGLQENKLLNITSNESSLTINGIEVEKSGFPISSIVFRSGGNYTNGITETSSIFVNEIERYIPCTLTMDLPASMDANNIARTKGTSGMWDLVSDRFYGNVANSGTFKAVNLAEGVDYEVHQWLRAEIPIRTSMRSLPINSANFSFTAIFGQKANITILKGETHEYYVYDNNMQIIRVWGYNGIGNVYEGDVLSNTMIVESTSAELLVNNIAIPQYSYPIKYLTFNSSSNSPNNTTLRVSKIYVDGIERYIPVKLLKSIPAKYDANRIARQAGECGMYDTVNDVFYGNVTSSGTFTVSDDS